MLDDMGIDVDDVDYRRILRARAQVVRERLDPGLKAILAEIGSRIENGATSVDHASLLRVARRAATGIDSLHAELSDDGRRFRITIVAGTDIYTADFDAFSLTVGSAFVAFGSASFLVKQECPGESGLVFEDGAMTVECEDD